MKQVKRAVLRIFFALEVCLFALVYFLGPQGMRMIWQLQEGNEIRAHDVARSEKEIVDLEAELTAWHQHGDFLTEKAARERLHMARPGELVYHVD